MFDVFLFMFLTCTQFSTHYDSDASPYPSFIKRAQIFVTRSTDHWKHARQFSVIFDIVCIYYDFPSRKPLKHGSDVTQHAFGVQKG
jgi:hypothetical protein